MNKLFATLLSLAFLTLPTYGIEMAPIPEAEAIEAEEVITEEVKELPYNFESTHRIPIKLGIVTPITTKGEKLYEGQVLQFKVLQDTYCKRKTFLKKGTIINGRIETLITAGMNGFPAEIILGGFEIPGAKSSQLVDTYTKKGQNRCFIVYPIKWALTILPPTGSLTNLIKGGHAKIKAKDEIVIYYYPEWK